MVRHFLQCRKTENVRDNLSHRSFSAADFLWDVPKVGVALGINANTE